MLVSFPESEEFNDEDENGYSFDVLETVVHVVFVSNVVEDSEDEIEDIKDNVEEAVPEGSSSSLGHIL